MVKSNGFWAQIVPRKRSSNLIKRLDYSDKESVIKLQKQENFKKGYINQQIQDKMGHLSTLNLVNTTKVIENNKNIDGDEKLILESDKNYEKNLNNDNNNNDDDNYLKSDQNNNTNDIKKNNYIIMDKSKLNVCSDNNNSIKNDYIIKNDNNNIDHVVKEEKLLKRTNLNEKVYDDWKGDKIFGIQFKAPLKWDKIIAISAIHLAYVYYGLTYKWEYFNLKTTLWAIFCSGLAGFGITAGAHRLWTHRSYKANTFLRCVLITCFSLSGQNTLYDWVRDHRVHHKFSETDADPHNSHRGFFFSHVGWLMMYKHPEVIRRGRQMDLSDILADPVVQFHQKYFVLMKTLCCFILPVIPPILWGDTYFNAIITQCVFRYVFCLNATWSVNSAAHLWGTRPYDRKINPAENLMVSIVAFGEGWHNYHHVFPWDYKAAEFGNYYVNLSTMFIDLAAYLGWVYDRKEPSKELVRRTIEKCGDGSHPEFGHYLSEVPMPDGNEFDENLNCHEKTK